MDEIGMVANATQLREGAMFSPDVPLDVPAAPVPALAAPIEGPRGRDSSSQSDSGQQFLAVYDTYFDFVWRTARRLGVALAFLDDVVQETFLVVHRRLGDTHIESLRGWIYGIAVGVVRNHRRTLHRKSPHTAPNHGDPTDPDELADSARGPFDLAQQAEGSRLLQHLLAKLADDKREVFVLIELEELSAPEVAEALGINCNTVTSRLRLARAEFEEAARRYRARDEWRLK